MFKILTDNWPAKLICLIIAIAIWAYIASTGAQVSKIPGGVPLEFRNTPDGFIPIADVETIEVEVSALRTTWSKINSDSIRAYVDLSNLAIGTHEVNIQLENQVPNVDIVNYTPKKILVRIDTKMVKTVPVNVKIEGSAGEGKISGVPKINPEEIEIAGAKSVVEKILEVYAVVRLDGEVEDINKNVKIVALNAENEIIPNVYFNPAEVNVTIPIVKAETAKTVGIKAVTAGQIASGYWISSFSINPSEIVILGKSEDLRNINFIETKPIDITNLSQSVTKNIDLNIPPGITLENNISQASVYMLVENISTIKEITPQIVYENLSDKLVVDSTDPQDISIIASGQSNKIANLTPTSVKLKLDLADIGEGTHNIDITYQMFETPDGIIITNYNPTSIKIKLKNK